MSLKLYETPGRGLESFKTAGNIFGSAVNFIEAANSEIRHSAKGIHLLIAVAEKK